MKIIVAKTAGFCMGVKRAVDLAIDNSGTGKQLFTLGPLIHNQQTIEMLGKRGVASIDSTPQITDAANATVLVRAHGVPPDVQKTFAAAAHRIIDGTCPKVKTVHKVIQKYRQHGYSIIIAGDTGHAEVTGLLGYAGDAGYLIQCVADVAALPDFDKVCLVSQTTFDRDAFAAIVQAVESRYAGSDVVVKKTICAATDKRQEETKQLAAEVDAMIVVGGRHSANTQRLASVAQAAGIPTQLVETEQEIDWEPLSKCATIGVTAGASTPSWMITRIVDYLHLMERRNQKTIQNLLKRFFDICANLNILTAVGAVSMYYTACFLQGFKFYWIGGGIVFLYFFSMYLWNSLTNIEITEHLGLGRYQFYHSLKTPLFVLTALGMIGLFILSAFTTDMQLYLMIFATLAGAFYYITFVPKPLRRFFKYGNLKDIPTSRDLFVALAWGVVCTLTPHAINRTFEGSFVTFFCFLSIFILAYLRALIFDLRDIEGDRIMGRETLVTIVGERNVKKGINFILIASGIVLLTYPGVAFLREGTWLSKGNILSISQIPVVLYISLFIRFKQKLRTDFPWMFNLIADGQFLIAGLCAWIFSTIIW